MPEQAPHAGSTAGTAEDRAATANRADVAAAPGISTTRPSIGTTFRAAQVRLRFLAVFIVAFLIVGKWDTWTTYWGWLTRGEPADRTGAVSANTEYFCPMCPGVISDWPNKCPVCNMALVRRDKHEPQFLPEGVVARMQFSPYRLQLAGIRTSPVEYRPLAVETIAAGRLQRVEESADALQLEVSIAPRQVVHLSQGQSVSVECPALPGRGPWRAHIASISREIEAVSHGGRATIRMDESGGELWAGMSVTARIATPLVEIEPFRSQPSNPPPPAEQEPRSVFTCPNHGNIVRTEPGLCPLDKAELVQRALTDNERLRWSCPVHIDTTADLPTATCEHCAGMQLVPRIVTYRPIDRVLAVPESAVVDWGEQKVVYVERMAGMFDGVPIIVGPRAGGFYSVVSGLSAEQRVASAGTFQIDAETRLNPNVASSYFGATTNQPGVSQSSGSPAPVAAEASIRGKPNAARGALSAEERTKIEAGLSQLSPADRALAEAQRVCPVTKLALGSMGKPVQMVVAGRTVFVCCAGCEAPLRKQPQRYLAKPAE